VRQARPATRGRIPAQSTDNAKTGLNRNFFGSPAAARRTAGSRAGSRRTHGGRGAAANRALACPPADAGTAYNLQGSIGRQAHGHSSRRRARARELRCGDREHTNRPSHAEPIRRSPRRLSPSSPLWRPATVDFCAGEALTRTPALVSHRSLAVTAWRELISIPGGRSSANRRALLLGSADHACTGLAAGA